MSMRQRPTKKQNVRPKKPQVANNNSSNGKGNRPRNQDNARRNRGNASQGSSFMNPPSVSAAYATGTGSSRPRITGGNQCLNIKHKEFIGNISGLNNAAFNQSFALALNPGVAATYPWLSIMAQNWQAYRFRKMRFFYFTRTGSTTVGSVILCPDYDAADVAPISEQVIDSYEDAKEDAPWKNIECTLNSTAMHLMGPKKFIRFGALPANQDIKTYDVGNMFIYTVDSAAAGSWGKLWVEYDVDFFTPQLPPGGSSFTQQALIAGGGVLTAAEPLGSVPVVSGNMQIVAGNNGTNSTLVVSNAVVGAEYSMNIFAQGAALTNWTVTPTGATLKSSLFNNYPAAASSSAYGGTFTSTASTMSFVIIQNGTTVTGSQVAFFLAPTASY